ncbi:TNT domain-containing protein [Actinomadura sp. DC4]|uniref:TNT domain-containing protein n=1 Tax=Actinomadura sp. DC4 TaxID=3055069 RepID=UPI0025AF016D|nr:TNT domain-containing protein [Actinomadura sp. DC4]MDN3358842.1 TNT domain-containing protein [Actinomadura sp. DC4]
MARDYDTQLLESVAVRRRRLRDALLFGRQRARRTLDESINKILIGLCVAAVVCAGCVGWSLVKTQLLKQKKQQQAQAQPATSPTTSAPEGAEVSIPAAWVGAQVTLPMLREALGQADVPASLYVLPGQPARASSYYLLAKTETGFTGGTVEGRQGRIGGEFGTEDEACRWLYAELVIRETPPARLTAAQEQQATALTAALVQDAKNKIAQSGGAPVAYPLDPGRLVDAFGQESGATLSPDGTPFGERGQPRSVRATVNPKTPKNYHRYRVVRSFRANASLVSPGGGVRLTLGASLFADPPALPTVRWLLRNGYLGRVAVTTVPR